MNVYLLSKCVLIIRLMLMCVCFAVKLRQIEHILSMEFSLKLNTVSYISASFLTRPAYRGCGKKDRNALKIIKYSLVLSPWQVIFVAE